MQIKTDYNLIGKLQYFVQENLSIISSEYTDIVTLELMIPLNMVTGFQKSCQTYLMAPYPVAK